MCIDYVILSFACYIYYSVSITSIEFHHVIYQKVSTTKYQWSVYLLLCGDGVRSQYSAQVQYKY